MGSDKTAVHFPNRMDKPDDATSGEALEQIYIVHVYTLIYGWCNYGGDVRTFMSPAVTNQERLDDSWARARHRPGELRGAWHALDVIMIMLFTTYMGGAMGG